MRLYTKILTLAFLLFCKGLELIATPSTTYWTVCTTAIQADEIWHIGVDNYFTLFNGKGHESSFPPDAGLTYGLFNWKDFAAEAGFDYLGGANHPLYFNAKIGMEEGKLFPHFPAWNIGIFDVGTYTRGRNRTNQNIVDVIIGKSLPKSIGGMLYIGAFSGSRAMGKNRQGWMIGFMRGFCKKKDCDGKEYDQWVFAADYASGRNTIGGGGAGLYYYFTPTISLLGGPVFFNDAKINGRWKWTIQLDIDL
jgi:hypothetical protein